MISGYVAGTVDCVFPRPVTPDSIEFLMDFAESAEEDMRYSITMSNAYNENKEYIPYSINGVNQDDVRQNFESFNILRPSIGHHYYNAFVIYTCTPIIKIEAKSFSDLISGILDKCSGTIRVTFFKIGYFGNKITQKEISILKIK